MPRKRRAVRESANSAGAILATTMAVSFWHSRNSRTALIVVLLLVSLATASVLAIQAQYSAAGQRAAAEGVLRDYSALVADEAVRRATVEVGYYGYATLSVAVANEFQESGALPSSLASTLPSSSDARVRRASVLAKYYFQLDRQTGEIRFVGELPPAEIAAWLRENLIRASQRGEGPFQVFSVQTGSSSHTFVTGVGHGPRNREAIVGFEADLAKLTEWFGAALNHQPLVPASLGHGKVTNDFVRLRIRDQEGIVRYRLGAEPLASFVAAKPFGDAYQSVLAGFQVETSIDPQIARQIVLGGLPRSRLRLYQVLLALNAALIVMAILQLRREMALQKLRDEFVSSVSHELRTPLTQIRMFAETLVLDRLRSTEERHRAIEIIDREARRLTQLVENVLQFSRMERKVEPLSRDEREIAPLVQETVEDFSSMITGSENHIETRLKPGLFARVDPGALRQIVINLLDNAVKYGKKPQQILVGLGARDGSACLFVEDEGPGVPPADRKRIFERFQRLDRDRQSSIAGTGIGLSVVRDLVKRHEGKCFATTGDRGGARFVVELPLSAPAPSAQTLPDTPPHAETAS